MLKITLHGLETLLNKSLHFDPETLGRLAELEGKIVKIVVTDWDIEFFLVPNQAGISLYHTLDNPADITMKGTLNGLFRVGTSLGSSEALFMNAITTEGDMELGHKIRAILSKLDIDWEEALANRIGDSPANKISNFARQFKSSSTQSLETLATNIREYLQLELNALPTPTEVADFVNDVTQLCHAVERAEARLKYLTSDSKDAQ